jgi:hypothetical protein
MPEMMIGKKDTISAPDLMKAIAQKVSKPDGNPEKSDRKYKTVQQFMDSHLQVQSYYDSAMRARARQFDFSRGNQWDSDELAVFSRKRKAPVVFNLIKTSERTVVGMFIQNKYDIKFSPMDPSDQDLSDVLNKLYIWLAGDQNWRFKDVDLFRQAWIGGVAYQEVYVKIDANKEPKICTKNNNPFAIYWDPESRSLIERDDAEYVDRVSWLTWDQIAQTYPEAVSETSGRDEAYFNNMFDSGKVDQNRDTPIYRDNSHRFLDQKNGRIKVIERFYKTRSKKHYTIDESYQRAEVDPANMMAMSAQGQKVSSEEEEMLNLVVIAPAWNTNKFLFDDLHHCQPRDYHTGKIIWPILEFCAESLNGDPQGFVEPMMGANKVLNSAMSNVLHANKHAASTSLLRRKGAFTEENGRDFDRNQSDGDRVFVTEKDMDPSMAVAPVPRGAVSQDSYKAIELAKAHADEVSSTPPAIKGITESSSTSGILNAQRIEQAFIQLQGLYENWKMFLRVRAKLSYYYMREYFPHEKTIRITAEKPGDPEFMTVNKNVEATDEMGRKTGEVVKINDISAFVYDIAIEDSQQSSTFRQRSQQQLSEIMQSPIIAQDPALANALLMEFLRMSDASKELKEFVRESSGMAKQMKEMEMQAKQGAVAEAMGGGAPPAGAPPAMGGDPNSPQGEPQSAAAESLAQRPTANTVASAQPTVPQAAPMGGIATQPQQAIP